MPAAKILTMFLLLLLAAGPPPRANATAAWSTGYVSAVTHFCDGWDIDLDAVHHDRGLPPLFLEGDWAPGGPGLLAYRDGMVAGKMQFERRADFCARPLAGLEGARHDEVAHLLRPMKP